MTYSRTTLLVFLAALIVALSVPVRAQQMSPPTPEPDHIRGRILAVEPDAVVVETRGGGRERIVLNQATTVLNLGRARFTDVNFGTYVGSVSRKLNVLSPIMRDSMSWLHEGFELRVIDDALRGVALGHRTWDLTPESVMTHGWVDDIENRVLSIKYGPTEFEETDVEVGRDTPVLRMSLGDRGLLRVGETIFAGADRGANGQYTAAFIFVGPGIIPPL